MAYDGIQFGNRVDHFTERKLNAKVVDNVLNSRTYFSRLQGMGKPFMGKTMDYTIKITDSGLGEFYTGLETLNTTASDTTIQLSYAHTAFQQPIVIPMLEAMANTGPEATIDMSMYKLEEAVAEAVQKLGTAGYGTGSGNQFLGLEIIVDDGQNGSTIGGQSRSTYSALNATRTASGGTLTLAKMATLYDTISASGISSEEPNIIVTTKTIWSLYEQLLQPAVRATYNDIGYQQLAIRGDAPVRSKADLKGAQGFTSLQYRGIPMIKDDACTSGVMYMLNENYFGWRGRTVVPDKYQGMIKKVDLGEPKTMEGVAAAPSEHHGWFFQDFQMAPNQAGIIGRYHVIGQVCVSQPRRNGKLTGITSV